MICSDKSMARKDLSINYARQHIMAGLLKARKNADKINAILRNRDSAVKILTKKFSFSSM
jgi:DNA gyrase/topoisomerase IV subunit A